MNQLVRFDTAALNRALIGFDRIFNSNFVETNYPPFNIIAITEEDRILEVAVTGFMKEEISVEIDQTTLIIKGNKNSIELSNDSYLHRGLATRDFERRFTLAENMQVESAEVANGLLRVYIKHIVPEALKLRQIIIK